MPTVSIAPPAGWYPDPLGEPVLRWWDDRGWTEHTALDEDAVPDGSSRLHALPAPDPEAEVVVPEPALASWADWRQVARRVRELAAGARPSIAHLVLDDRDPIVIDTRYHAYGWTRPLDALPRWVLHADVVLQLRAPIAPTVFSMRSGSIAELVTALESRA